MNQSAITLYHLILLDEMNEKRVWWHIRSDPETRTYIACYMSSRSKECDTFVGALLWIVGEYEVWKEKTQERDALMPRD